MNYKEKTYEELIKELQQKDKTIQNLENQLSLSLTIDEQSGMFSDSSDMLLIITNDGYK